MSAATYFAYGSNMLRERLLSRCPGATLLGRAALEGFRLSFEKDSLDGSGKCALEPSPGDVAEGVLWRIPEDELAALDRLEGVGSGYERSQVKLQANGQVCEALTYRATTTTPGLVPYDWYLALVVAGAQQQGLPPTIVEQLRRIRSQRDPDPRRQSRQEALEVLRSAGFGEMANELRQE